MRMYFEKNWESFTVGGYLYFGVYVLELVECDFVSFGNEDDVFLLLCGVESSD